MAKQIGTDISKSEFKVYLIDLDTISDHQRTNCTATADYSPSIKYSDSLVYGIKKCNHALDLYQLTSSFYEILFQK